MVHFLFIGLAAFIPLIAAQSGNTFVGCTDIGGGQQISDALSAANCADLCVQENTASGTMYRYSYYLSGDSTCYCDPTYASADSIQPSGSGNSVICNSNDVHSVFRLGTTFVFDQCYSSSSTGTAKTVGSDIEICFETCKSNTEVIIKPGQNFIGEPIFLCYCTSSSVGAILTPSGCSFDNAFRFTHPPAAAASGLTRRRRALQKVSKAEEYCPRGMTACRVSQGSDDSYECLDVSSELESCGGCLLGQYKSTGNDVDGINCMTLDDSLDFGSMTCRDGQCVKEF